MAPPGPPMPVPSKAAIRALRGLVLGTTCTLALVTEDRRRRINAARSAIRNGDRIRSARRYHPGGSAFAIALEEDSLSVEPGVINWKAPTRQGQTTTASTSSTSSQPEPQPPIFAYPPPAGERIQRHIPSLAHQAEEYRARARLGKLVDSSIIPIGRVSQVSPAQPAVDLSEAMADQAKALAKPMKTEAELEAAVRTLMNTWPIIDAASDQTALGKTSAELCQFCQRAGRMDLAQAVLQLAVKFGQLDEATYFAHDPLPVVRSLVPLNALKGELTDPAMEEDGSGARRAAFVKRLEDAASLFLPTFTAPHIPDFPLAKIVTIGKKLLKCAFAAFHHELINTIYTSIAKYPGDITEFTQWYNEKMQSTNDHALLVSSFVARPPSAGSLSKTVFLEIGGRVAEASRLSHYTQAGAILDTLIDISAPATYRLRTAWGTDLLYGEWQKNKDYKEIKRLFAKLIGPRKEEFRTPTIYHVNGVYRVMVQIAFEADKPAEAKALFDELLAFQPTADEDIRLTGLFALAKAKAGDWQGVQDDFQKAADAAANKGGLNARDTERVFVPIAKEYIRTHTIGETEDFLKQYIDEVGVPIGRNMVTLLANEYGALREVRSFVGWLDYCVQAGFAVDAAFSNAILHNCRKHWKMGFRELRIMYRKLRLLSPNFEDKVTQTIMTHAAISDARSIGRPSPSTAIKSRVVSLRMNNNNTPHAVANMATLAAAAQHNSSSYASPLSARHLLDEHDLYVAMKHAFASGSPTKAVRMYKHAVRGGMPPSEKCLKLAVAAAVKSEQSIGSTSSPLPTKRVPDFDVAVDLLKTAHMAGQDIDGATAYLAIAYIDALGSRKAATTAKSRKSNAKASVAAAVKSVLLRLDACDVQMTDLALNRAAFHMFKAGHMSGAIALAMSAANSPVGGGRPGYNVWNFSVLIAAHARLADADGIRAATEGAAASGVLRELMGYRVLKQSRGRLRNRLLEHELSATVHGPKHGHATPEAHKVHGDDLNAALQAVEDAINQAREARQQLSKERRALEAATISIMQQAALDAGHPPVDFDKRKKSRQKQHEDISSTRGSVSSGSSWDLLDMPVDQDGQLIEAEQPRAAAAVAAY
ncbi:hypothetical protein Sste5344_007272 [Sporothrix stenoceras]